MNGRYLLDTTIMSEIVDHNQAVTARLNQAQEVFIPSIVLGELYFGVYKIRNTRRGRNLRADDDALLNRIGVLPCDRATADFYAQVRGELEVKGQRIPRKRHVDCGAGAAARADAGDARRALQARGGIVRGVVVGSRRMEQHIHTIAAAIVRRGEDILLVRQQGADDPEPRWALPGGMAEPGELLHEALARELREETGLGLLRLGSLIYAAQTHIAHGVLRGYASAEPEEYIATAFVFEVAAWQGELAEHVADPDGFVSEARFFPAAEALALLDRLSYRPMREPIVAYLRGEVPAGALWLYRRGADKAGDADATLLLRVPGDQ